MDVLKEGEHRCDDFKFVQIDEIGDFFLGICVRRLQLKNLLVGQNRIGIAFASA